MQMLNMFNRKNVALGLVMAATVSFTSASNAALVNYSQNFEGMVQADPDVLGNDGWLVFGNVFDSEGGYLYGYGPFPAPNACVAGGGPAFSCVAAGEGGSAQGTQQLVVFSDYNNGDHGIGNIIESNVFQEQTIAAGDVGKTMRFSFDAKKGDIGGLSTASAFIKTVDDFSALTNFIAFDTTSISTLWGTYNLSIVIDASLIGQKLQFGFLNTASGYESSGIVYDNVNFGVVPIPPALWLFGSGLLGLVGMARRKKS